MLDIISGGRAVLGAGSGYLQHEFEGFNINPEEKRDRFDENLDLLQSALTKNNFSFLKKFNRVKDVSLNVHPLNDSGIPVYVAVLRKEAAYHVGKKGYNIICVPYASVNSFNEVSELIADYRRGYKESGKPGPGEALFAFHTHVAENNKTARDNAEACFNLYADTRLYAKKQNYEDILKSGLGLFGSPTEVNAKLNLLEDMGVDNVLMLMNFGMMKNENVMTSMKMTIDGRQGIPQSNPNTANLF
jgi:alkanesulfonate monooxygenase SsuD/methylene tetrahydromethanopterin reductase-like flavin-dependent oxidoreductase (luciferase family)